MGLMSRPDRICEAHDLIISLSAVSLHLLNLSHTTQVPIAALCGIVPAILVQTAIIFPGEAASMLVIYKALKYIFKILG